MNDKGCFIAIHGEYCGIGSTLETAFASLKSEAGPVEVDDVEFYSATKLVVELQLVIIPDGE